MKITAPDYKNGWLDNYIGEVPYTDLMEGLKEEFSKTKTYIESLSEEKLNFRYAEGKWTMKEIAGHLCETERVFSYRALTFARKDKNALPGYDEQLYAQTTNALRRTITDLLNEWSDVRRATISLFNSFEPEMLDEKG
ncbi:MAG: DinB family protein, partial [Bacteroidota bacterium]